jgi:hypothetical protein
MAGVKDHPNLVLDFVVNKIIEGLPERFSRNNCRAVAVPMVVPQNSFKYVQVYYNGSSFEMGEGDANLVRRMTFGVRLYSKLASHELNQVEETTREIINMAYDVSRVVHGLYDIVEAPLDEAAILENESPIRGAEVDGSYLMYLDQSYRCHLHATWPEVKSGY